MSGHRITDVQATDGRLFKVYGGDKGKVYLEWIKKNGARSEDTIFEFDYFSLVAALVALQSSDVVRAAGQTLSALAA